MIAKNGMSLVRFSVDRPRLVTWTMALFTLAVAGLAALPSVWPPAARALNPVRVDPGPENMFSAAEPVRVFHNAMKAEFALYDMGGVGVVNEANPDGVFNVDSLGRIYELAQYARTLRWPDPGDPDKRAGVIEVDMLAPSTVDNIEQAGPPYLPLTSKDLSYRVRQTLLEKVADWPREDRVYITGLPVAEDTFGVEMFYQMAIS